MIYFGLLSIKLSKSHNSSHVFCGLTQVNSDRVILLSLVFRLNLKSNHPSTISYWKLDFIIYFDLVYEIISIS